MSDFSCLFSGLARQHEEEADDGCQAKLLEAKGRLGAAESKGEAKRKASQEAVMEQERLLKEYEESAARISEVTAKRAAAEGALKEARSTLAHARRAETAAQQRLDRAQQKHERAQDQTGRSNAGEEQSSEAAASTLRAETESMAAAKATETILAKAWEDLKWAVDL